MATTKDLKTPTLKWLEVWCNEKNVEEGLKLIHPSMTMTHDDGPTRDRETYVAFWKYLIASVAPNFKYKAIDAVQDGRKVWVYARITGLPGGEAKDSVDMFEWDEQGEKMLKAKDVQRTVQKWGGSLVWHEDGGKLQVLERWNCDH